MMKKLLGVFIFFAALLLGSTVSHAENTPITWEHSLSGASTRVSEFYSRNEQTEEEVGLFLSKIDDFKEGHEPIEGHENECSKTNLFTSPKEGIVCTFGNLNIRMNPSILSKQVTQVYQLSRLSVVGEKYQDGYLWYLLDMNGTQVYASAYYIKFGDEAQEYLESQEWYLKANATIPDRLVWETYNFSVLSNADREDLKGRFDEINYCAGYTGAYCKAQDSLSRYSVLSYMEEVYKLIINIAEKYRLENFNVQISKDLRSVQLLRENLKDETGQTDEDFARLIQKAEEERKAKERYTYGEKIANYAASFVGILPYVWGGASLKYGADCSGFCAQIYAHFGHLPQSKANVHGYDSLALRSVGYAVDVSQIQPGDLVCYMGHVAIYYGSGLVVHEPSVNHPICSYGNLYMMPIITVRRLF